MKKISALFALGALVAAGCGGDDQDFSIPSQEVAGSVDGMTWNLVGAYAEADAFNDGEIRIELHADATFESCGVSGPEGGSLFFSVPAEPGRYELSFSFSGGGRTATFFDGMSNNVIAASGVIEIDDITDDAISGGLNIEADGDNAVAGMFTAERCPEAR